MSGTEYGKKGCKKQTGPRSRNKSNHVQKTEDCKKTNEQCVKDEKKMMPIAMDKISNKILRMKWKLCMRRMAATLKRKRKN